MKAKDLINESKVADIKKLARAAAKKFKAGDESAKKNPHSKDPYLGKVWRETFDKMVARIPEQPVAEAEGELLLRDRSTSAGIARDILTNAARSLYKEGKKPTKQAILDRAETMAGRFYNQILQAIDHELEMGGE